MKRLPKENDTLANLSAYRPGPRLADIQQRYGLPQLVTLASNESPEGPFPAVVATIAAAAAGLNRYPDGGALDLRDDLAAATCLRREQVVLGNGSCELLLLLSQAFVDRGDAVVFAEPSFTMYRPVAEMRAARVDAVPLRDGVHDLEAMAAAVGPKTKMVIICNPNNPTGTYIEPAPLREFVQTLPEEVVVVLDEAYIEYVTAVKERTERWLEQMPNLVILRTFSKIYGLAGLRVGYGLAGPDLVESLDKVRQPFNVNSLAQAAAREALRHPVSLAARLEHVAAERERLGRGLEGLGIEYVRGSQANFILVRIDGLPVPAPEVPQALLEKGVITRSGYSFGCPGWLRVTIGSSDENDLFLELLAQVAGGGTAA